MAARVFLLSPANSGGQRMGYLLNPRATFALARELQRGSVELGAAYQFASGLYFRGKLAYARAFARPPPGVGGALVIAPGRGLLEAATAFTADDLRALGAVPVDLADARYRLALQRDAGHLAARLGPRDEAVLLGSIASGKYADLLLAALGKRLFFPKAFVGRGDMSRGGLLLRCVQDGVELDYAPLDGAVRRGARPPRLPRR